MNCQVPISWTSFKPPWGSAVGLLISFLLSHAINRIQQLSDYSQSSRPSSRNQGRIPALGDFDSNETSRGPSPPAAASFNAIRPKTSSSIRSNRSPTLTCSQGTYIPGSVPSKCVLPALEAHHLTLNTLAESFTAAIFSD
jgi:hypothetical protein